MQLAKFLQGRCSAFIDVVSQVLDMDPFLALLRELDPDHGYGDLSIRDLPQEFVRREVAEVVSAHILKRNHGSGAILLD